MYLRLSTRAADRCTRLLPEALIRASTLPAHTCTHLTRWHITTNTHTTHTAHGTLSIEVSRHAHVTRHHAVGVLHLPLPHRALAVPIVVVTVHEGLFAVVLACQALAECYTRVRHHH